MADPTTPLDSARTRALVERLLDDATPVRRLWRPSVRCGAWLAGVLALAIAVLLGGARPDLATKIREPAFVVEIVLVTLAAALLGATAWREAVPGDVADRRTFAVAIAMAIAGALLWLTGAAPARVHPGQFLHGGLGCAMRTAVLAALPWGALLVGLRRGAPLAPARAGLAAGAAAFLAAAVLVRVGCASDERLHLLVWHGLPLVAGTTVSGMIGLLVLGRWRRPVSG